MAKQASSATLSSTVAKADTQASGMTESTTARDFSKENGRQMTTLNVCRLSSMTVSGSRAICRATACSSGRPAISMRVNGSQIDAMARAKSQTVRVASGSRVGGRWDIMYLLVCSEIGWISFI